jgi:hypothetical protein
MVAILFLIQLQAQVVAEQVIHHHKLADLVAAKEKLAQVQLELLIKVMQVDQEPLAPMVRVGVGVLVQLEQTHQPMSAVMVV